MAGVVDVIGGGRVGRALHARATARGCAGALVTRTEGWEGLSAGAGRPLLVCTRNDDLTGVVERIPRSRREDLVFVQNGALRPWLQASGLAAATRGLLFFAVPTRGDDVQPGTQSPFTGPRAAATVGWLRALGVEAAEVEPMTFATLELEKLVWNSAHGLVGSVFELTVGEALEQREDTLEALVHEYVGVGAPALGVSISGEAMLRRVVAYSRTIPTFPARAREWPWRNGWFEALARAQDVVLPVHDALASALHD